MKKGKNANYDFSEKAPKRPMGHGEHANLPSKAIMRPFSEGCSYRDGIVNSPMTGINEEFDTDENGDR